MSEDEAIEIILDNKKEYERIIKELDDVQDTNGNKPIETIQDCQKFVKAIETILDLYKKEKEKNKNLIKQLQEQNTEIQDISKQLREKEQEDIKIRAKFILSLDDYITKDKIRAKIKELEEKSDYWNCDEIEVLKELLERR